MRSVLIFIAFFSVSLAISKESGKVEYFIDIDQAEHHMAKVTAKFPSHAAKQLTVNFPVWRSGRYEILDLPNGVREFKATGKRGKALDWKREDKGQWIIQSNGEPVTVSYRIYANQLGNRTRHIDDSHAFLDASAVFVYSPTFRDHKLTVELDVPRKWRSRSGMKSLGKHKFVADNYDVFIDSPIETGIHEFYEFDAGGRDYEILFWGRGNYDQKKIIEDLAKLDAEVEKIWVDFPYSRYLYMIHATSGPRGATEHINSTIMQRQRDKFGSREDYINFMLTAAHELIHTWNVKAYRPAGLVPYDFQKENYSPLLWVAEGSTSYLDTLITRRAGITTQKEFHKDLKKGIEAYWHRPGRHVQSMAESSFSKWIEATNDFTLNHSVNIYSKGSLLSWYVDYKIRRVTNDKKSSEDVHRLLYQRFNAAEKGYTEEDMIAVINEVTGTDFTDFWNTYVRSTGEIPFEEMLDYVGLRIKRQKDDKQIVDLGWKADDALVLTHVRKDSVAWNAGLTKDDILVSIDGLRLTKGNLKSRVEALKPGKKVKLHFFRRDELRTVEFKPVKNPDRKLAVVVNKQANDDQKRRYKEWTGHDLIEVKSDADTDSTKSDAANSDTSQS